ncbi:hypothetical protein Sulku_2006 [Sulfuricurvum kujiense DSM 16994]|uniref:Lipoprotein n=1 Tax=Sulfuricurvum kujiense (strain ATCC BAA-921 / DSM 16994 / JCM 11577 / YK-1) TaxID=709032 RepID=E4U2H9_SULKY|nr:hypothetical protein [Sulfuricurvum kujiense]ADR34666.1 hypothetical protein Sulku_2006 [Sulfuricurvum kujiense DSM 16994]
MKIALNLVLLLILITFSGCGEGKIYSEIVDPDAIDHPPHSVRTLGPNGWIKSDFTEESNGSVVIELITHHAACTNPQSRSLGADFDGYVRVTIQEDNHTIARGQMDFKGKPTPEMAQAIYDTLLRKLHWRE